MTEVLSQNTKAILLLTAPLIAGPNQKSADPLTPTECKKLALQLREHGRQPADLLTPSVTQILVDCDAMIDAARINRLLARGFSLSQAVERWRARAIWVVSRADAEYPRALKARLKEDSPPLLYGCGDREILDSGGLAVVGSRNVDDALIEYSREIGRLAASAGRTLVSGGARGVDQASMRGALEAGGRVIGVLADSLEKTAMSRDHRNMLLEGQLALISPYDPGAAFNVGHAMMRNKLIYALADAALVVNADLNKGGTWQGASEQLEKLQLVPVYVRSNGSASKGLDALMKKGAHPWPSPVDADGLNAIFDSLPQTPSSWSKQSVLPFGQPPKTKVAKSIDEAVAPISGGKPNTENAAELKAADELYEAVRSVVVRLVRQPKKAAEVALDLGVTHQQAQKWLTRLTEEGVLQKSKKPVRYSLRQTSLFDEAASSSTPRTKRAGFRSSV